MLCDICHKNLATIHLTEIKEGKISEVHICQDCAAAKKGAAEGHLETLAAPGGFSAREGKITKEESRQLKCKKCGLSYQDFKAKGKLGCRECYRAFKPLLIPLLKEIHAAVRHQGKVPGRPECRYPDGLRIANFERKLNQAVKSEEYEEAAFWRDKIKKLKEQNGRRA